MQAEDMYQAIWQRKNQDTSSIPPGTRPAVALSLITKGTHALDIGCGDGTFAAALAQKIPSVAGVDISSAAVEVAKHRGIDARVVNMDAEPLPFADGTFDVVTCLDVLEHVFDPRISAREIARVSSPGARLVLSTPNMRYWKWIRSQIQGKFPLTSVDEEGYDGGHLHYYTAANLAALIAPWFDFVRAVGIPGGQRRGLGVRIIKLVMPGQRGDEFSCPGIAVVARRNDKPVMQ